MAVRNRDTTEQFCRVVALLAGLLVYAEVLALEVWLLVVGGVRTPDAALHGVQILTAFASMPLGVLCITVGPVAALTVGAELADWLSLARRGNYLAQVKPADFRGLAGLGAGVCVFFAASRWTFGDGASWSHPWLSLCLALWTGLLSAFILRDLPEFGPLWPRHIQDARRTAGQKVVIICAGLGLGAYLLFPYLSEGVVLWFRWFGSKF